MLLYGGNFVPFNLIPDIMNRMSLHISQIRALTTAMGSYLKVGAMGGKFGLDEVTKVGPQRAISVPMSKKKAKSSLSLPREDSLRRRLSARQEELSARK